MTSTIPYEEFTLTATRGGHTESVTVIGQADTESVRFAKKMRSRDPIPDAIVNDAVMTAIAEIMNRGYEDPLWAKGHIRLVDSEGDLIKEMEAS